MKTPPAPMRPLTRLRLATGVLGMTALVAVLVAALMASVSASAAPLPSAADDALDADALVRPVQEARDAASALVDSAVRMLGVRYRRGGTSADKGFDCSGFTRYVFEHSLGLVLPHRAVQQASNSALLRVTRDQLQPGDLVFFGTLRRTITHVGIYIGEGRFIHAPRAGESIRIDALGAGYWARHFSGARRADLVASASAGAGLAADEAPGLPAEVAAP